MINNPHLEFKKNLINSAPIPELELKQLGVDLEKLKICENSLELRKNPPALVIAECVEDVVFTQGFRTQKLKKKQKYIMSLGIYKQLRITRGGNRILRPSGKKIESVYRPYIGQNLKNKKLLVSRTGGFGDLLFIQPNLIYLKEKYPTSKIIFSCAPQYVPMLQTWECVDELVSLPINFVTFSQADYHAIFEGLIERNLEAQKVNAYNLFSRWLGLDLPNELLVPKQKPKKEKIQEVRNIINLNFNLFLEKFIVLQPRASSIIRSPREGFWVSLIEKLIEKGMKIIITDIPQKSDWIEKEIIGKIREDYRDKVFNFSSYSKSMDYSIALVSLSEMCVATDSSIIHIAASLGKKIYGVYGPFPGEIRLTTYPNCKFVNGTCPISPCFTHGHNPCQKSDSSGFSICYDSIDIEKTSEEIVELFYSGTEKKRDD